MITEELRFLETPLITLNFKLIGSRCFHFCLLLLHDNSWSDINVKWVINSYTDYKLQSEQVKYC